MKLVLANNQSERFVSFYNSLRDRSPEPFDYSGYTDLLFIFDTFAKQPIQVLNTATNKSLTDYDGVYINGYLNTFELAAAVAICCDAIGVGYQNKEMHNPPSLSKLSMYAKLLAAGVTLPISLVGSKKAILHTASKNTNLTFPAVLKRADADRGIDNFKVKDFDEVAELLKEYDDDSIWVLQQYVENKGFHLVTFYDGKPTFCIYRTLEARPDGNSQKAHMYKPQGGANASLIPLNELEEGIVDECYEAINAMNRQIGSVDCIYDPLTKRTYILEVNYNPQFVTIETLKDVRIDAFLDNLKNLK